MSLIALKKVDLFKAVPTRTLDSWLKGFNPLQREYRKGNFILLQGKEYNDLCCILSGEASAEFSGLRGQGAEGGNAESLRSNCYCRTVFSREASPRYGGSAD
jgi:hypothetical protein